MSDKKWTCADLLRSYRFWVITFLLVLSLSAFAGTSYGASILSKSPSIPAGSYWCYSRLRNGPSDVKSGLIQSTAILYPTLSGENPEHCWRMQNENTGMLQSGQALFWALLFPVGTANIQAKMNRFIVANAENASGRRINRWLPVLPRCRIWRSRYPAGAGVLTAFAPCG
ncbi:hypothetical protein KCP77_00420 [Salmonella enterica subsp. enterica]|nr:hypothetical protein KCP77_00420 [Salmonella enterica subsp. enterica]